MWSQLLGSYSDPVPQVLRYGLNHVTTLVENKLAKLVTLGC